MTGSYLVLTKEYASAKTQAVTPEPQEKTNIPKIIKIKDMTQATTGRLILTSVIYI